MSKTAKKTTPELIIEAGADLAREKGLEAVTHREIGSVLGRSTGNVSYHFSGADDLRRAVALQLIHEYGTPQWGLVEFWVIDRLPEGHQAYMDTLVGKDDLDRDNLLAAEAFLWLARHGVTADA